MQDTDRPGISSGIARPPYNKNATVFRDAVYKHPEEVSLRITGGDEEEEPSILWVGKDMQPGDQITVVGRYAGYLWSVYLTCEGKGKFGVHRLQPDNPEDEEQGAKLP